MNSIDSLPAFMEALISFMRPKYPTIAGVLDFSPDKFTPAITRIRELCEGRGILETQAQIPYVVANLFAA